MTDLMILGAFIRQLRFSLYHGIYSPCSFHPCLESYMKELNKKQIMPYWLYQLFFAFNFTWNLAVFSIFTFLFSVDFSSCSFSFSLFVKRRSKKKIHAQSEDKKSGEILQRLISKETKYKIDGVELVCCNVSVPCEQMREECVCGLGMPGFKPGRLMMLQ